MEAIVYTSNTGYTAEYAKMLGVELDLPVIPLNESKGKLKDGSDIMYLGWLMGGIVKGYKKASEKYKISVVCGVGMGENGSQLDDVRKVNKIPPELKVFTLQGGFSMEKLHGIYKFMMSVMKQTVGKKLSDKADKTKNESDMLDMLQNGGSHVCKDNIIPVVQWCKEQA